MKRFPKNARVCFLGDSITHNNGFLSHIVAYYHKYFKEDNINFYNCGVGGGHISTLLEILEDDILWHCPTHTVIMIGINDSERSMLEESRSKERLNALKEAFEIYKKNLSLLCKKLVEKNIEVILCTPTPYDEYLESEIVPLKGGCALLSGYAEYVRNFAKINGFEFCDYHAYITQVMQENILYHDDRVHPNELGHYYIAKCFLEFQGLELSENEPFPEYMKEWQKTVEILRNIRMVEHLFIKEKNLSDDEKITYIEDYLKQRKAEGKYADFIVSLSNRYLEFKPLQRQKEMEANNYMEIEFKK